MFVYKRKAMYHETDQMGIIHHSNYVKWMEEARIACMDAMGFSYREVEEKGVISPVTGISVEYKKQVCFDDELDIRVSVRRYNGIVLEFDYEIYNTTKGEISTKALSKHCFLKNNQLISLKKTMPELDTLISDFAKNTLQ